MSTTIYATLLTFTDQGARNLSQSPQRASSFVASADAAGVRVVSQLWTAGSYDGVLILEGEEQKVLSLLAQLAAQGNVRTHSMRAFDAEQFGRIVAH